MSKQRSIWAHLAVLWIVLAAVRLAAFAVVLRGVWTHQESYGLFFPALLIMPEAYLDAPGQMSGARASVAAVQLAADAFLPALLLAVLITGIRRIGRWLHNGPAAERGNASGLHHQADQLPREQSDGKDT